MRVKKQIEVDIHTPTRGGQTELGRLAVGKVDSSDPKKPRPVSTDYFVARGQFAEIFKQLYGDRPSQIPIQFTTDNDSFACDERFEIRTNAGKLYAFGDGEVFTFYNEKEGCYSKRISCSKRPTLLQDTQDYLKRNLTEQQAKKIKWRRVLTLRFCIVDFPYLGYWQFSTFAEGSSIPAIRDAFDSCKATFGAVRYIPFLLSVKKVSSNKPGVHNHFSVVSLVPSISLKQGFYLRDRLKLDPSANPFELLTSPDSTALLPPSFLPCQLAG